MKKTYINPTLTVAKVQPANILTGSLPVDPTKETSIQMGRKARFYMEEDWDEDDFDFEY